jgi:hypothetical protein
MRWRLRRASDDSGSFGKGNEDEYLSLKLELELNIAERLLKSEKMI